MANYTEFYCDIATGSNINAGDDKTVVTSTNGDWGNAAANRFTAASGTPFSGVAVGDFASVYLDGATTAVYIARVTAVNAGGASLDLSATVKVGTAPTTSATGRSCTVGGKWKGPNGTDGFPLTLVSNVLVNTSGYAPRVNLKAGTYSVTAAISRSAAGVVFQGYTSAAGDGGRWTLDGGSSGASYTVLANSGGANVYADMIVQNNGATGSAAGLSFTTTDAAVLFNVKVSGMRGAGLNTSGDIQVIGCEFTANNTSNSSSSGGFTATGGAILYRCYLHDNTGSNASGAVISGAPGRIIECVISGNGQYGVFASGTNSSVAIINSDIYNNTSHGVAASTTGHILFTAINSNFVKNGGYGVKLDVGAGLRSGYMLNCGFGGGADANTSGDTNGMNSVSEIGKVSYTTNPWTAPATGDYDLPAGSQAIRAGYGTIPSLTLTTNAPNIGVGNAAASTGGGAYVWAQ